MQTEFTLYNGPDLWASVDRFFDLRPATHFASQLLPRNAGCRGADYYEVQFWTDDAVPVAGWLTVRARVILNGGYIWAPEKPLSWYVDEPTDWHSGIARWDFPGQPSYDESPAIPPLRWALTARRSA